MRLRVYKIAARVGLPVEDVLAYLQAIGERHHAKDMVRESVAEATLRFFIGRVHNDAPDDLAPPFGEIWALPESVLGFSRKDCARPVIVGPVEAGRTVWVLPGTSEVDNNSDRHRGITLENADAVGYKGRGLFLFEEARNIDLNILLDRGTRLGYLLPPTRKRVLDELLRVGLRRLVVKTRHRPPRGVLSPK